MRPDILAVKAVNQYRRRDILSYLGLRYYLANSSANRKRWITEVATSLVQQRHEVPYFKTKHFKGIDKTGKVTHRTMYIPGPNEALAEVALLSECAKHDAFNPRPYVYSYRFAAEKNPEGVFEYYFNGYKARHHDISKACCAKECDTVLCTDIKKFYPSIPRDLIFRAWDKACRESDISERFFMLGKRILSDHHKQCRQDQSGKCLLTGPIFSHMIANLVLRDIDDEMNRITKGHYWRYVDDITLSGTKEDIVSWRAKLATLLQDIGLELHTGEKDYSIESCDWLSSDHYFSDDLANPWISLIADVKRFLLAYPESTNNLAQTLICNNIRIPIKSCSKAVSESSNLERFLDWYKKYSWSWKEIKKLSIQSIVGSANYAKEYYSAAIDDALLALKTAKDFDKKRIIPKIRFCAGRLTLLANEEMLLSLAQQTKGYLELHLLSQIMYAVAKRDASSVLELGTNATQSVAQIFRMVDDPVTISTEKLSSVAEQSLAILLLNGISVKGNFESHLPLYRFATGGEFLQLMSSDDAFIKELASLHGIQDKIMHNDTLDEAFDRDEQLSIDVIDQLQQSCYG